MPASPDKDRLHIVMAASEAVPYAKTGGLADVVGALPQELVKLGHRVTLILPAYPPISAQHHPRRTMARFTVPTAGTKAEVAIEEVQGDDSASSPRVLAVRYDPYFDRPGLYQSQDGDYPDNLDRFALFSRSILTLTERLTAGGEPTADILHLHDWQTALCAVYLKAMEQEYPSLAHLKTLLTIHNIGYQGMFPGGQFVRTGLAPSWFSDSRLEFYGSVNLLKGGILFADAVSTVSPTYAREIMTKEFGAGLEGVLAGRADGVKGITNGIDVALWNPETDPHLPAHYSSSDLSGKQICKQSLQRELGLPVRDVPLLVMIGRLTGQKGFDLVAEILPELLTLEVQLAVLGTGDRALEEPFRAAKSTHPDRLGLHIGFDEGLAHRMEAGADLFLMPSRYEPCGLTQLYSLRYGTVPIVRRTGGLADTIVPFKPTTAQLRQASGFHFIEPSSDALLNAVLLALEVFKDRKAWQSLVEAGMRKDVSWGYAAKQYEELYRVVQRRQVGQATEW